MDPQQHVAPAADASSVGQDIGALYLEHREVMYRVAYSLLRADRHNRAEDVIGEVMISIVKNPPRQEVRNWEAFLVRAVQNKVRDLWKSAAHRHDRLVIDEASPHLMPKLVNAAELPHARLHYLRHLHATTLLLAGVPPHVVANRLGHADASITLRVYAHVLREHSADIGDVFASAVGSC